MAILNQVLTQKIASDLSIKINQVEKVLELLSEGNTVPFIARYRKEQTGALDEEQIREISKEYEYQVNLEKRKEDVLRLIEEKGKLTKELKDKVLACDKLSDVEDLYRPYKEKKKTRATDAISKGLEPLAEYLLTFADEMHIVEEATRYVDEEKEVSTPEEALQGAQDIISEMVSDDADIRKFIKGILFNQGLLVTKVKKEDLDPRRVYSNYYDYQEPINRIVSHRILAVNRAEAEKVLKVTISEPIDKIIDFISHRYIKNAASPAAPYVSEAIQDGYKRLIKPSIEREIRAELKDMAEEHAIEVFSINLKNLLLQPPMKGKVVLGVDPAFRTGCKIGVVSDTGKVLAIDVIYPHEKYIGEVIHDNRVEKSKSIIKEMINKYNVEIIAIGNGTASRESEEFIAKLITEYQLDTSYIIVNEAGASVYSASELAKKEFPDLNVEERSAISISRRLQDPLSELVKIDPKSIGVGQYQHDVTQNKLADSLNFVVETTVNRVGVNVNTASEALLKYVSGCNATAASNIVAYRDEFGKFENRKQLLKVPRFGPKSYEQAVGFLRIIDGNDPLDKTGIHPENYSNARLILTKLGFTADDLGTDALKESLNSVNKKELLNITELGEHTLNDILSAFVAPNRDPRDEFDQPLLKKGILKLEDLHVGMELQGTVRNVVDFGAFVDCGVKEGGLVHLSKMSNQFVKHPMDVVNVGDIVTVYVISVDLERRRLALSMIKLPD